jgi:hypothetical protein
VAFVLTTDTWRAKIQLEIHSSSIWAILVNLVLILPPLALFYYIRSFGVNVVFWDEWEVVPLIHSATNGGLSIAELFAQHNEFRPFFPRLLMLLLGTFTRFNTVAEMILSWVFLCLTGLLIFFSWRRFLRDKSSSLSRLWFLPISLLLFSFRQYEGILYGFNLLIYMSIFGSVAAFFFLESSRKVDSRFTLACLCGILASFSWSTGLLVWPVGVFQTLITKRKAPGSIILWILIGLTAWGVYSYGWTAQSGFHQYEYALSHPVEGIEFFTANLASPFVFAYLSSFGSTWPMAVPYGVALALVGLIIIVQMQKRRLAKKSIFGLSLIAYSLAASLAATVGRSFLGVSGALASRYTPNAAIGVIGLYIVALTVSKGMRSKSSAFGAHAMLALLLLGLITGYVGGWQAGQFWRGSMQMSAYVLRTYPVQSNQIIGAYLYFDTTFVREGSAFLETQKLNVFSEPSIDVASLSIRNASDARYAIDTCPEYVPQSYAYGAIPAPCPSYVLTSSYPVAVINSTQETITITGWAVDGKANSMAAAVFIIIDGQIIISTLYGLMRPDVANALKNPSFEYSGFVATFSSSILGGGSHTIQLEIVGSGGQYAYVTPQIESLMIEN